jgi:hypothetical protein
VEERDVSCFGARVHPNRRLVDLVDPTRG